MKSIFIFRKKCFRKFVSYKKCQKKFFREKGNSVIQVVNSACARKVRCAKVRSEEERKVN